MNPVSKKIALPILSLILTFSILYFLFENVQLLIAGDNSFKVLGTIIILALALFLVPFIFSSSRKPQNKSGPNPITEKKEFSFRLIKRIKLNSEFQPSSQVLCPHCNSPNPTFTKLCLYCGRKI